MTASERELELRDDSPGDAVVTKPPHAGHVRVLHSATTSVAVGAPGDGAAADSALVELIEDAPDGRIVIDGHGRILRTNAALETLFGYHRSELLGQLVEVLVPERARSAHIASRGMFGIDPKVRLMGLGLPLVGRHRDGSDIALDIRLSPLKTRAGMWVVADIRDDTQRRRAERHRQIAGISDEDLRIARALGETVIHSIYSVGLRMHTLLPRAGEEVQDELAEVVNSLDDVIREIRAVVFGLALSPEDTDQTGA